MNIGFPDFVRQKMCPRCGAEFGCGPQTAGESCWCDALPHVIGISEGDDCFCPACLAAACEAKGRKAETHNQPRESR